MSIRYFMLLKPYFDAKGQYYEENTIIPQSVLPLNKEGKRVVGVVTSMAECLADGRIIDRRLDKNQKAVLNGDDEVIVDNADVELEAAGEHEVDLEAPSDEELAAQQALAEQQRAQEAADQAELDAAAEDVTDPKVDGEDPVSVQQILNAEAKLTEAGKLTDDDRTKSGKVKKKKIEEALGRSVEQPVYMQYTRV